MRNSLRITPSSSTAASKVMRRGLGAQVRSAVVMRNAHDDMIRVPRKLRMPWSSEAKSATLTGYVALMRSSAKPSLLFSSVQPCSVIASTPLISS